MLLLICCLVCFPLVVGVLCLSLFCCALLCVRSSFAILKRKRELVALRFLSYWCLVTVNVLCLFLKVPWVGLRCVWYFLIIPSYFLARLFYSH